MMRYSHIHARRLWRLLCPQALLYTEMVPAAALANKVPANCRHDRNQNPIALQIAGNEPDLIAHAASAGARLGYAEINLNCGCPSADATAGGFGACLMRRPATVAACVRAAARTGLPLSVKCRLGVDNLEDCDLDRFVDAVAEAGIAAIIVHARKAWLGGLNPKQNRSLPPLDYNRAIKLKQRHPELALVINGGITTVGQACKLLKRVDGVMIGRMITSRPLFLTDLAAGLAMSTPPLGEVIAEYLAYAAKMMATGEHPRRLLSPLAGLVAERPCARTFRQLLNRACMGNADLPTIGRTLLALGVG